MDDKKRYQDLKPGQDFIDLGKIALAASLHDIQVNGITFDEKGNLYDANGKKRIDARSPMEDLDIESIYRKLHKETFGVEPGMKTYFRPGKDEKTIRIKHESYGKPEERLIEIDEPENKQEKKKKKDNNVPMYA